ncbi:kinase-like protein [Dichomitus squalens LYAD-421 SS1]|uniref:Kinase-like protein n=1 Tax=Dichomitus squalens (strain LYAD-421) TaxID=732165 RepID=R7SXK5_DICSQ|nr:kinase-like protein [Dichomitus squalens LYAD-421 SS1]EJF60470.1 kinase-like protein [Dichomitus squalens LYAD-421 SS1]
MSPGLFSFLDKIYWRYYLSFKHSLDKTRLPSAFLYNGPDVDAPALRARHLSFEPAELITLAGDKYRIERKLRARLTSIVWLAEHTVKASSRKRFVAIETFGDNFSAALSLQRKHDPRQAIRNFIHSIPQAQNNRDPGARACDRIRSIHFGTHLHIVKDVFGPALTDLQASQPDRRFTLPVTKRIIRDTLLALQYIHSTGRTHVGVNSHNLTVVHQGTAQSVTSSIVDHLRRNPPSIYVPAKTGRTWPSRRNIAIDAAQPLPAFGLSPSLDNLSVRLGRCEHSTLDKDDQARATRDGGAFDLLDYYHALPVLCAPEAYIGSPERWSPPVNIWAVGHLTFQSLTGALVYPQLNNASLTEVPSYGDMEELSDPELPFLKLHLQNFPFIKRELSDRDVDATCAFLARCFEMDPGKRPTAEALLQDEWFAS